MFKKLTAIAILVISIPVMAYAGAWSLNTWARSAGGTISVNGGTAQSVTNGSQFANYTGGETVAVTITPAAGYTVKYFLDQIGNTSSETPDGTTGGTINITQANATLTGSVASLWAVFHATTISVTASGDANSTVNMTSIPFVYPGSVATRDMVFTFTATPGYVITAITNAPAANILVSGRTTATAKVTIKSGYVFGSALSFVATSAASTTLTTPNAGAAQAVVNGATATLTGTYVGPAPAFQNWSCVAKPTGATQPFAKTSAASVVIPAAVLTTNGTYVFQYRVSDTSRALTSIQVTATAPAAKTQLTEGRTCQACHTANGIATSTPTIYASYSASAHHLPGTSPYAPYCSSCHLGTATGGHPGTLNANTVNSTNFIVKLGTQTASEGSAAKGAVFCTACHNGAHSIPHFVVVGSSCVACHTTSGSGDAHQIQPSTATVDGTCATCHSGSTIGTLAATGSDCVGCHSVAIKHPGTYVNDNNGVRAILGANNGEFGRNSHHIFNGVGVAPTNAQCVACHLEGKVSNSAVVVDPAYHMSDASIHLRDAGNDADWAWNPQAATSADHTNMDSFCMSCHSASGATSPQSALIQAYLNANPATANTASASNPFGDLLSNSYDKQVRPAVVDVNSQFNTSNASHHAVKGKRYTTRSSATAVAAWVNYSTSGGHSTDVTDPSHPRFNARTQKTLYDGNLLGSTDGTANGTKGTLYTPLDTAKSGTTIGDDSQIHCGDCHTVGQWKPSATTNADGTTAPDVIGAHGSANEYMLRNNKGTNALHGLGTFICYNCHNDKAGGNTSGGYYASNYYNSTTGKWVTGGNQHIGQLHGGGSSVQYGGSSGCVQDSAGLAFTGYTSSIHNNIAWRSSWATPATSTTYLLGSNGSKWVESKGSTQNTGDLSIKLQSVLNGSQTVFFDGSGNFAGIYSSFVSGNTTPVQSWTSGQGNTNAYTSAFVVLDGNGTVIDQVNGASPTFGGTGRNHFVGGNILGIGCLNCHNAGHKGFGGIHGGNTTYQTGFAAGVNHEIEGKAAPVDTQKPYRFMPGLGNYGYIPAGAGKEPGTYTTDSNGVATLVDEPEAGKTGNAAWEAWNGTGTSAQGGCYTNSYGAQNAGWSGCNHHGNGGVNDGGPGGTQPLGYGAGEPPVKTQSLGHVGRTLNY